MANEHESHDAQNLVVEAQDLVVTEVDNLYAVTEEDLTTVAHLCTCEININ